MRYILLLLLSISFYLHAQDTGTTSSPEAAAPTQPIDGSSTILQQLKEDINNGPNINKAEELLDNTIFKLNEAMNAHSKLLLMKLEVLPHRVLVTKGKSNGGNDCLFADKDGKAYSQEDPANDCLKIEEFDFIDAEAGKPKGPKSKSMILFFDAAASAEVDPAKAPERKIRRLKSRVYAKNFYTDDMKLVEVIDEDPLTTPKHDDKIYFITQKDYHPFDPNMENPAAKGVGKYRLNTVENTRSFPLRNHFKREAYVKHMHYFERLLSKVVGFNEANGNNKVKENTNFLKDSLK